MVHIWSRNTPEYRDGEPLEVHCVVTLPGPVSRTGIDLVFVLIKAKLASVDYAYVLMRFENASFDFVFVLIRSPQVPIEPCANNGSNIGNGSKEGAVQEERVQEDAVPVAALLEALLSRCVFLVVPPPLAAALGTATTPECFKGLPKVNFLFKAALTKGQQLQYWR